MKDETNHTAEENHMPNDLPDWLAPILNHFRPDGFLINSSWELVRVLGRGSEYLGPNAAENLPIALTALADDLLTAVRPTLNQIAQDGTTVTQTAVCRSKHGVEQTLHLSLTPLPGTAQRQTYYLVTMAPPADTAPALAELEARLAEKSHQLQITKDAYQNFGYIVSHDLRAPLRTLNTYSQFLQEDYAEKFDQDGHELLAGIIESALHLDSLILSLLEYSRLDRPTQKAQLIDTQALLDQIVAELKSEFSASFKLPNNLPSVWGYESQLLQLFSHLIANGLKFVKPDIQPKIAISWEDRGDFAEFSVTDNGIGIDEKYFERIFNLFQRLHTADEFEGVGAGLAIAKKVVEKHGGQIWLNSRVGQGTTFTFTLAKEATGLAR